MSTVSKNIKKLRLRRSLTQEDMAAKLFVTRQTVSNWETGKSQPDIDMLVRIAEALSTDAAVLIYGVPDSAEEKKEKRRLAIAAGIVLILGIGAYFLAGIANKAKHDYFSDYAQLLDLVALPLFWLVIGWTAIQGLGVLGIVKPVRSKYGRAIHIAALVVVLAYATVMLPYLIELIKTIVLYSRFQANPSAYPNGFSYAFSLPDILMDVEFRIITVVFKQPVIFLIPGALYRLCEPVKAKRSDDGART